jgi:ribonuclease VapC
VIVDSSVVVAILLHEAGYEHLLQRLELEEGAGIGAPTLAETGIVLTAKLGAAGSSLLARFVQELGLVIIPFSEDHWPAAIDAFRRFGKGRHPAGLNFGDCLTYATARLADEALLCLGEDFRRTDLAVA